MDDHHGVYFLEKKMKKIQVNSTNRNDIVSIFGEPSTTSSFDNDVWIYIERKITNTHLFGKRDTVAIENQDNPKVKLRWADGNLLEGQQEYLEGEVVEDE